MLLAFGSMLVAAAAGCGALAELGAGDGCSAGRAVGGAPATGAAGGGSGGFAPHPPCASAEGVRLCGGDEGCPPIEPPDCPGFGCTPALDRTSFEPSAAGVCWADLPLAAARQCTACADGELCAQRAPDQLVCVPAGVCAALWDLGAKSVCRYADKSSYDHAPLPLPQGPCPAQAGAGIFCGGACGGCDEGWRCTGRSPLHPFGVCALLEKASGYENAYPCSLGPEGTDAPSCQGSILDGALCGVFAVAESDTRVARRYGTCLGPTKCASAGAFPGGLFCYDEQGHQVAP